MIQKKYNISMKIFKTLFTATLLFFLSATRLLADTGPLIPDGSGGINKFPNPFSSAGSTGTLYDFIFFIFNKIVLPIGAIVVVFYIIYAGFLFVKARGNAEELETAKRALLHAVIGAAIILGSMTIALAIKGTICQISGNSIPNLCSKYSTNSWAHGPL